MKTLNDYMVQCLYRMEIVEDKDEVFLWFLYPDLPGFFLW